MRRLEGKVALVTGGSRGLGWAIAERLATEGAAVALLARQAEQATASADRLCAGGATTIAFSGDVASEDDVRQAVAETAERLGRLDVMVNNAVGPHRLGDGTSAGPTAGRSQGGGCA